MRRVYFTVPDDTHWKVERARRDLNLSRSADYKKALNWCIARHEHLLDDDEPSNDDMSDDSRPDR